MLELHYAVTVLFFSRPWSEDWPHHGRTFSIYLSCIILTASSTGSPVHVLMLSIQAVHGLPRIRASGVVAGIIACSSQLICFRHTLIIFCNQGPKVWERIKTLNLISHLALSFLRIPLDSWSKRSYSLYAGSDACTKYPATKVHGIFKWVVKNSFLSLTENSSVAEVCQFQTPAWIYIWNLSSYATVDKLLASITRDINDRI